MKNKVKAVSVPPNPERLIESLTSIGYSLHTAIADLVDNSIQAGASDIWIDMCAKTEFDDAYIIICDNGKGMSDNSLQEAMKFGSEEKYLKKDLGKFGLGLKTASLSKCRALTVISKARIDVSSKPKLNIYKWDMSHVYGNSAWEILKPKENELEDVERKVLEKYRKKIENGGTMVIWSDMEEFLPDLYTQDQNKKNKFFTEEIRNIEHHLGLTFHRFIDGHNNKKELKIFFSKKEIESIDPFLHEEQSSRSLEEKIMYFSSISDEDKSRVVFSPYILPREDQFSSPDAYKHYSKRIGTWLSCQGFYFYRNNRLLKYGDWSSCDTKKDKKHILLRVAVDFNEKLDLEFEVNVSKEKASIPKKYRNEVSNFLREWIKEAKKSLIGKNKNKKKEITRKHYNSISIDKILEVKINKTANKIICKKDSKGKITIDIPKINPLSVYLEKKVGKGNKFKELAIALILLLQSLKNKRLKRDDIPSLNEFEEFFKGGKDEQN